MIRNQTSLGAYPNAMYVLSFPWKTTPTLIYNNGHLQFWILGPLSSLSLSLFCSLLTSMPITFFMLIHLCLLDAHSSTFTSFSTIFILLPTHTQGRVKESTDCFTLFYSPNNDTAVNSIMTLLANRNNLGISIEHDLSAKTKQMIVGWPADSKVAIRDWLKQNPNKTEGGKSLPFIHYYCNSLRLSN